MKKIFSWEALEYEEKSHSVDWFWGMGLTSLSITAISFYMDNFLFGIILILASLILIAFAIREPRMVEHSLTDEGLVVGTNFYSFADMKSFYIQEFDDGSSYIVISTRRSFLPKIIVTLSAHHPPLVREFLLKNVPEVVQREPITVKILDRLGF